MLELDLLWQYEAMVTTEAWEIHRRVAILRPALLHGELYQRVQIRIFHSPYSDAVLCCQ